MREMDLQQTVTAPALAGLELPEERLVVPTKRRLKLADLHRERAVIAVLAGRDFKVKYKQSLLGPLWLIFQPLALLGAMIVAFRGFAHVKTAGVPYAVFTLVGLSVWSFFQASMTIGTSAVISNANFVRFTPCPRPAFPIAGIIASFPAFGITAAGAIVIALVTGSLSPTVVLLPFGFVWLLLLTAGVVGITSSLAVRYRDVISILPFLLQVGIFLAPVGYALSGISGTLRVLVDINPLTGMIEAWRWMMLSGFHADIVPIAISLVETVLLVALGWYTFTTRETTMADVI